MAHGATGRRDRSLLPRRNLRRARPLCPRVLTEISRGGCRSFPFPYSQMKKITCATVRAHAVRVSDHSTRMQMAGRRAVSYYTPPIKATPVYSRLLACVHLLLPGAFSRMKKELAIVWMEREEVRRQKPILQQRIHIFTNMKCEMLDHLYLNFDVEFAARPMLFVILFVFLAVSMR